MGLTKDDLTKARHGFAKLIENPAILTAKAKKKVQQERKLTPGAPKKAGTALRKEHERSFKDYAPGAKKLNKAVHDCYHLRERGAA